MLATMAATTGVLLAALEMNYEKVCFRPPVNVGDLRAAAAALKFSQHVMQCFVKLISS